MGQKRFSMKGIRNIMQNKIVVTLHLSAIGLGTGADAA